MNLYAISYSTVQWSPSTFTGNAGKTLTLMLGSSLVLVGIILFIMGTGGLIENLGGVPRQSSGRIVGKISLAGGSMFTGISLIIAYKPVSLVPTKGYSPTPTQTPSPSNTASVTGTDHWNGPTAGVLAWIALVIVVIMLTTLFTWAASRWHQHNLAARKLKLQLRKEMDQLLLVWQTLHEKRIVQENVWLSYEKDLRNLLRAPAMGDMSVPTTREALLAMGRAGEFADKRLPKDDIPGAREMVAQYKKAVLELKGSMQAAVTFATKDVKSSLSVSQRGQLRKAQHLLDVALGVANPYESRAAWQQVRKILDQLDITIPNEMIESIETTSCKSIEATGALAL